MLNKLSTDGIFTINDNGDRNFTDVRWNTIQCYINAGLLRTGNELDCPSGEDKLL
jgi:hypothetical protein